MAEGGGGLEDITPTVLVLIDDLKRVLVNSETTRKINNVDKHKGRRDADLPSDHYHTACSCTEVREYDLAESTAGSSTKLMQRIEAQQSQFEIQRRRTG